MTSNDKILRLGVISNPLSGGNRRGLTAIHRVLVGQPHVLHRRVQTPEETAEALADFARKEVAVVAVNGGDGTIQAVLTGLFYRQPFEQLPLLALLRAGTDSVIPGDVGLRGSRESGLRRLLKWTRNPEQNGVIAKRNIMRVRPAPDQEPRYGMIFGAAIVYQATRFTHRRIHSMGLGGELAPGLAVARFALAILTRNSRLIKPVAITLGIDQQPAQQHDFLLVVISTLERLFLGLRPFWGIESGALPISAITAEPKHLLRVFPSLARGRTHRLGIPENGYLSHRADKIQMTMNTKFTLDGQVYAPDPQLGPVVVENGGQASFLRL
jgi:diacylglycerol kinase family enzyme